MDIFENRTPQQLKESAKALYTEERETKKILNGWFLAKEISADASQGLNLQSEDKAALELEAVIDKIPLEISENAIFAGTQRDAFAASYALINPAFEVETFRGYCDPLEVYDYATPNGDVTAERIAAMRARAADSDYVRDLNKVYSGCSQYTGEVAFFVEQVTGHLIPDFRRAMKEGISSLLKDIEEKLPTLDEARANTMKAMARTLKASVRLAHRYADIAAENAAKADVDHKAVFQLIEQTLRRVPEFGARTTYEAMQSYLLLWQVMCLE